MAIFFLERQESLEVHINPGKEKVVLASMRVGRKQLKDVRMPTQTKQLEAFFLLVIVPSRLLRISSLDTLSNQNYRSLLNVDEHSLEHVRQTAGSERT